MIRNSGSIIASLAIAALAAITPTAHADESLNELYRLCRAVDAAVDGVAIHAECELYAYPIPDEMVSNIISNPFPGKEEHPLRQSRIEVYTGGFIQSREIETFMIDGRIELKTRTYPTPGLNAGEFTEIFDVDKRVTIGAAELGTDKLLFDIENRPIIFPVLPTGVYHFGRGLSEFIGYPMELERRDDNRYDLTVWNIDQSRLFMEFVLNPEYGMCWEEAKLYLYEDEAQVNGHAKAKQYQHHDGVWIPMEVIFTSYYPDGEIHSTHTSEVTNVSFIKDKDEVMQQLQLLNLVKPDDVVIDSRNR